MISFTAKVLVLANPHLLENAERPFFVYSLLPIYSLAVACLFNRCYRAAFVMGCCMVRLAYQGIGLLHLLKPKNGDARDGSPVPYSEFQYLLVRAFGLVCARPWTRMS